VPQPPELIQKEMDNLFAVISYCENIVDCRRSLTLAYFGEVSE
jgi:superfamily II DNA helicase RecQ